MKTETWKSMGLEVKLNVPETVDEFDQNAKRVGACLEEATSNVVYRGSLAQFRSELCDKVEAQYKIERKTKATGKVDAEKNPILAFDETESEYIDRVVAAQGIKIEALQPLADEVSASIVFDASARERKAPQPKKLAAKYSIGAASVFAKGTLDAVNVKLQGLINKTFTPSGDTAKDTEALGWLIKEYTDAFEAQQLAGLTN